MKNLIAAFLWTVIFMSTASAQVVLSDTISIYEQGEKVGQVIAAKIHEQAASNEWELLLQDFQKQLKVIQDQIPEYENYEINFVKDYSITIEEHEDEEEVLKYVVKDGIPPRKTGNQSTATLHQKGLKIKIFFDDVADLSDPKIEVMIKDALSKLGKKPNFLAELLIPANNLEYNFSDGNLSKKKFALGKFKAIGFVNPQVGFYKNKPIFSMNYGLGFTFKNPDKHVLSVGLNTIYQYSEEHKAGRTASFYAITYAPWKPLSFSYGFNQTKFIETSTPFSDLKQRFSISVTTNKAGAFTLHLINTTDRTSHVAFDYGIPLSFGFRK